MARLPEIAIFGEARSLPSSFAVRLRRMMGEEGGVHHAGHAARLFEGGFTTACSAPSSTILPRKACIARPSTRAPCVILATASSTAGASSPMTALRPRTSSAQNTSCKSQAKAGLSIGRKFESDRVRPSLRRGKSLRQGRRRHPCRSPPGIAISEDLYIRFLLFLLPFAASALPKLYHRHIERQENTGF